MLSHIFSLCFSHGHVYQETLHAVVEIARLLNLRFVGLPFVGLDWALFEAVLLCLPVLLLLCTTHRPVDMPCKSPGSWCMSASDENPTQTCLIQSHGGFGAVMLALPSYAFACFYLKL